MRICRWSCPQTISLIWTIRKALGHDEAIASQPHHWLELALLNRMQTHTFVFVSHRFCNAIHFLICLKTNI
jgi:hypothetical protein